MNLRKDHYRSVPGNATVCQRRTRSLCRGWVWRSGCQPPTPKGLSNSWSVGREEDREEGRRSVLAPPSSLLSFFFAPRPNPFVCAGVSAPGNRPRKAAASARNQTHRRPAPTARTGRLTGIAELASLLRSAWAGCSKSSPPATATAGRPEVSPRYNPTLPFVSERCLSKNTKRVYNS